MLSQYTHRKAMVAAALVLLALVSAALACSPGTPAPTEPPTAPPTPERTAPEAQKGIEGKGEMVANLAIQAGGKITLTLVNDLSDTVCYVFISPPSEDTWGNDWLGSDEVIASGAQRAFSVDAGLWDVMAADCDGNELASEYAFALNGNTTWTLSWSATGGTSGGSAGGAQTYTIANNSGTDICYVYISPTTSDSWGADWLGSDILYTGTQYAFYVTPGAYDILLQDCSGNILDQEMDVRLAGGEVWTFGGGSSGGTAAGPTSGTQPYTIVNNSGTDICYVYISPTTSDSWGSDWLGNDLLYTGTQYTFYITPGAYDILLEDCDQNTLDQEMNVYLAGGEVWTFGGGGPVTSGDGSVVLSVINNTDTTICYLHISPSSASDWGDDWLGSDTIAPWTTYNFWVTPGTYDLWAEDCNGNEMGSLFGEPIYEDTEWEFYTEGNTSGGSGVGVTFINDTSEPVCYVWIGVPQSEWIGDALGSSTIPGWGSLTVYIEPGTWALQAEDCSGAVMKFEPAFNAYNGAVWHINP